MRPLLVFARPKRAKRKPGKQRKFGHPHLPDHAAQARRLNSRFEILSQQFPDARVQEAATGLEPEKTLVLETIGPIDRFAKACARIEGLEFIAEALGDDLEPDDHFWWEKDGKRTERKLSGYAYLALSNQKGLETLLAHWNRYKNDTDYQPGEGLTPLRYLFEQLRDIRYWNTDDRLRDSGLQEDWKVRLEHHHESLPVEIELWYHGNLAQRETRQSEVSALIQRLNGHVVTGCTIPQIGYDAILASIPSEGLRRFVEEGDLEIDLLKSDLIFSFRPVGQCAAPAYSASDNVVSEDNDAAAQGDLKQEPVVAMLDGLPLENHLWLRDRLAVDDPDEYADAYQPEKQTHGTAMASLIIHGDKNANNLPLPSKLYARPVMQPETNAWGETHERVPETILPLDLVHRSVKRMFDDDGNDSAAAPTVKAINLSVCDPHRLFDRALSPWAKLLDWLSFQYNVIFVVSAGNHVNDVRLDMTNADFDALSSENQNKAVFDRLISDLPNRRLMSPAESINAITVAGLDEDDYDGPILPVLVDCAIAPGMPSPINPLSWGARRSVKPDALMPAGKIMYRRRLPELSSRQVALTPFISPNFPPGQKAASPSTQTGNISGFGYARGTSNAAALATREIAWLHEVLQDIYGSDYGELLNPALEHVLLKALFIHGAEVGDDHASLRELLPPMGNLFKSHAARFTGYGAVNGVRIKECSDSQATLLQADKIHNDESILFELPLPDCLSGKAVHRRLIVTLAWLSPINPRSSVYRQARLVYTPATHLGDVLNPLAVTERAYDHQMVRKGTALHEIIVGDKVKPYISGETLKIEITCKADAGAGELEIPFGLVVTLDSTDNTLPIYDEVKAALDVMLLRSAKPKERVQSKNPL